MTENKCILDLNMKVTILVALDNEIKKTSEAVDYGKQSLARKMKQDPEEGVKLKVLIEANEGYLMRLERGREFIDSCKGD